ncbi:MAG: ATP-binding cassette domain-containing protein [Vicinamibacterales bacterium]
MTVEPVLELVDATVVKGGARVLDGVTLTIRRGDHTAIVGPNGAGKSTLVNLITQHERALRRPSGEPAVRVFGSGRWDVFALRPRLGVVSAEWHQRFVQGNSEGRIRGLEAVLSGFVASQGIVRYGTFTSEMRDRAEASLARMDASHLGDKLLHEMSNGEARRVLLARALVTAPEALLLDEPTAGLDLVSRHRFMERVRDIARGGTTLVLVTHHVDEIIPEIDHVVLLRRGRVVVAGRKAAVLTAAHLSETFDGPISVHAADGYLHARATPAASDA